MKTTNKKYVSGQETIDVHEKFLVCDVKYLDSKYRITLGEKLIGSINNRMKVDSYHILCSDNGDILLRPSVTIPSNEAWLYNHKVYKKIQKGLAEAKAGKTLKIKDIDSYLSKL